MIWLVQQDPEDQERYLQEYREYYGKGEPTKGKNKNKDFDMGFDRGFGPGTNR